MWGYLSVSVDLVLILGVVYLWHDYSDGVSLQLQVLSNTAFKSVEELQLSCKIALVQDYYL